MNIFGNHIIPIYFVILIYLHETAAAHTIAACYLNLLNHIFSIIRTKWKYPCTFDCWWTHRTHLKSNSKNRWFWDEMGLIAYTPKRYIYIFFFISTRSILLSFQILFAHPIYAYQIDKGTSTESTQNIQIKRAHSQTTNKRKKKTN